MRFLSTTLLCALLTANVQKAGAQTADSLVEVIVQYRSAATRDHEKRLLARGGAHHAALAAIHGAAYSLPEQTVEELAGDPLVEHVSLNRNVSAASSEGIAAPGYDYTPQTVYAPAAWDRGYTGKGIGVAVIDSGVSPSESLSGGDHSRIVYSESFVNAGRPDYVSSTADEYGHGTHVAGIIASSESSLRGDLEIRGIAPRVNIINLRVLDKNGTGRDSDVILAIQRAIQLKTRYNIRVINLSLGRPVFESYKVDPLCQAVEAAWRAGILTVASAGNEGRNNEQGIQGYGTITAPGNDPYVLTAGAMKSMYTPQRGDDRMASYSSKGPSPIDHVVKPDIVAPGNRIISLLAPLSTLSKHYPLNIVQPGHMTEDGAKNGYFQLSGTSMAAAVVSGAAALLLDANDELSPDTIKARLMKSASKDFPASSVAVDPQTGAAYTTYYDLFTVGAGYLNVLNALSSYDTVPSGMSALSPIVSRNSTTGFVSLLYGNGVIWGTNVVWDTAVIWGSNVVYGANAAAGPAVAGSNVVWGDGTTKALNIIWGDNVVWGDGVLSADNAKVAVYGEN